jgi:hypothetical protein
MRITREKLLKLAKTQAAMRVMQNRRLVCVYLTGSLLDEEPLLGGTADIDLIFVHDTPPPQEREIGPPLGGSASGYRPCFAGTVPAAAQSCAATHGWAVSSATIPSFFTSAAIGLSLFRRGSARTSTVRRPSSSASSRSWMPPVQGWMTLQSAAGLDVFQRTCAVPAHPAANRQRRRLPLRSAADRTASAAPFSPAGAGSPARPELSAGLIALLSGGTDLLAEAQTPQWFETWQTALGDAGQTSQHPPSLHPARWAYYTRAAQALWSETPAAALWIVLRTWCAALDCLPADHASRPSFVSLCRSLALDPAGRTPGKHWTYIWTRWKK